MSASPRSKRISATGKDGFKRQKTEHLFRHHFYCSSSRLTDESGSHNHHHPFAVKERKKVNDSAAKDEMEIV